MYMFKDLLYNMLCKVNSFDTRGNVMERLVQEKLDNELMRYEDALTNIQQYLMTRDKLKVIRRASYNLGKRSNNDNDELN